MTAIKANLAASNDDASIEQVQTELVNILSDLQSDSDLLDENHKVRVNHLTKSISHKEQLIEDLKVSISNLDIQIASLEANITRDEAELKQVKFNLQQARLDYDANEAHYAKWKPFHEANIVDLRKAVQVTSRAIAKMDTYQSAVKASLIQIASSSKAELMALSTEMSHLKPVLTKLGPDFSPLVFELIALTANPDYSKADKILELLHQLKDKVNTGLNTEISSLDHLETSYAAEKDRLRDLIDNLEARETQLEASIKQDKETLAVNKKEVAELRANLAKEEQNLADLKQELETENKTYEINSTRAQNLISLMDTLIKYWREKFEDVNSYVRTAVNTGNGTQ